MVGVEIENGPIQRPELVFPRFQESNSDSIFRRNSKIQVNKPLRCTNTKAAVPNVRSPTLKSAAATVLPDEPFSLSNQKLSAMPSKINSTSAIVIVALAMTTEAKPSTIGTLCFLSR